ncbi:MAG: hypothetical protein AB7U83_03905 [Vicinamibacterales bacterium]
MAPATSRIQARGIPSPAPAATPAMNIRTALSEPITTRTTPPR